MTENKIKHQLSSLGEKLGTLLRNKDAVIAKSKYFHYTTDDLPRIEKNIDAIKKEIKELRGQLVAKTYDADYADLYMRHVGRDKH